MSDPIAQSDVELKEEHTPDIERTQSWKLAHKFSAAKSRVERGRSRAKLGKPLNAKEKKLEREVKMVIQNILNSYLLVG